MGWISRIETGRQSWRPLRGWLRPCLNSRRWLMRALLAAAVLLGLNAPAARANVLIAIDKSAQQMSVSVDGASEKLAAAGIRAATRAGAARLSFGLYNSEADADRAAEALTSRVSLST